LPPEFKYPGGYLETKDLRDDQQKNLTGVTQSVHSVKNTDALAFVILKS